MNNGGRLTVELSTKSRYTKIIITDSGMGIAKENLPYILNPFFTTKSLNNNYGLGLSYCYKVLQKHGGTLEISSIEKHGTVVTLTIPNRKRRPWTFQKSKAKSVNS
jgi:signal transduction histidine kinase